MKNWTSMQKRAAVAAAVLVLALFPNLVTVLLPLVAVLVWAAGQTLIVGVVVGAVFFAGRGRRTAPKRPAAPANTTAVSA